ncbi:MULTISPECIES: DUF3997 domain-containing protein [Olivibacter]|uniref:DUF3997 domain-containing protein n=1 Tax=Olivibacter oleidegradans TaxID=760123 RepID=A0ABV6HGG0_9SPHI|nr:DUF3997 domain-containing protein [Olivibacter jilunii]
MLPVVVCLSSCSYSSSDYTDDLGDDYLFVSESNANQIISGPNDTTFRGLIPCTVIAYEFDGKNIIAKQKNNPECDDRNLTDTLISYWIIDKKKNISYGPLDSMSYIQKRQELSVSSSLNF